MFSMFSWHFEENEEFLGIKGQFWAFSILIVRSIAPNLCSRALALGCPSQGMSAAYAYAHKKKDRSKNLIERTTPVIERSRVPLNSVAVGSILKIGLGFVLRFLGFLGFP